MNNTENKNNRNATNLLTVLAALALAIPATLVLVNMLKSDESEVTHSLCSDADNNMFGSNCGFEGGDFSGWNFEDGFSDARVVCDDGNASEGDCYLEVWIDRSGRETDCTDGIDNDSDGDMDGDDWDCTYYMEQVLRSFSESDMPAGQHCELEADYSVISDDDPTFMFVFQVIQHSSPWATVTDEFGYQLLTAYQSDWTTESTNWTMNEEVGVRRVAVAQYGNLPHGTKFRIDNVRMTCS